MFLFVPKNVVFKLASKTVKLGGDDEDGVRGHTSQGHSAS